MANLNKLQQEAEKRISVRTAEKRKGAKHHSHREYDVNIKESYKRSSALINDDAETMEEMDKAELQKKHLESIIASGPCKRDS